MIGDCHMIMIHITDYACIAASELQHLSVIFIQLD